MFGDKKGRNGTDDPFKILHTGSTGKGGTSFWAGGGAWPRVTHDSQSSSPMLTSRQLSYSPALTPFHPLRVSRRTMTYNRHSGSMGRGEMNQQGGT